jgi:hypothetical protein
MLASILISTFVASYVGAGILAVKTVVDGPAFERKSSRFDLRINYGDHVRLIALKPAPIIWEEPEAYFPVHNQIRVPVPLGYKVETLL